MLNEPASASSQSAMADNKRLKALLAGFFLAILLASGIFIFFRPIISSGFQYSQSDIGDTVIINYFLEHSFQTVFNQSYRATAWSPLIFYPQQDVLAYSENLWGSEPVYWAMRILFSPETSFQLWMIIISILNFLAFYILARSLGINKWFAGFGSFLFAFCLPRASQVGHQQLLPQFFSVLALLFFWRFVKTKKFINFVFFEAFVYLQLLAGIYLGWFFLLSLAPLLLVTVFWRRNESLLKLFLNRKTLASTLIFLLITAATFMPYYRAEKELGGRSFAEVQSMMPSVDSYVNVVSDSIFYGLYPSQMKAATQNLPMRHEQYLFLGLFFYLLLFVSAASYFIARKKSGGILPWPPIFIASISVFVFITAISIRIPFTDFSFWVYIHRYVPGAGAIRALARIWTVSYLYFFIAAMTLASAAYLKTASKMIKICLIALGLLACIEQIVLNPEYFNKLKQEAIQEQIDAAVNSVAQKYQIGAFYLRWPVGEYFAAYQSKAAWTSLHLNLPTINGYSGNEPIGYKSVREPMSDNEIIGWLASRKQKPAIEAIAVLDASFDNGILSINKTEIIWLLLK